MPTISVFYGILIQMFWQEHAPPHFHALYGEFEALIDIRTFEVRRGFLPRRALLLVNPVRNSSGALNPTHPAPLRRARSWPEFF